MNNICIYLDPCLHEGSLIRDRCIGCVSGPRTVLVPSQHEALLEEVPLCPARENLPRMAGMCDSSEVLHVVLVEEVGHVNRVGSQRFADQVG